MGLLCKIFRFLLNVFSQIVTVVAEAIGVLGSAVVDVLSDIIDSVVGAVGSSPLKLLLFAGCGYLAYTMFFADDEDDEKSISSIKGVIDV